ncbi:MAG: hypothetical protein NTV43_04880 [Methylococcales bacterium]|nr:hypothetical protein [Methylococcales bacterium]
MYLSKQTNNKPFFGAMALAAILFMPFSAIFAATPPQLVVTPLANGILQVSVSTGTISVCSTGGTTYVYPPVPAGRCIVIGRAGNSSTGYLLTTANYVGSNEAFVFNKTTGNIFQCMLSLDSRSNLYGACKIIDNSFNLR